MKSVKQTFKITMSKGDLVKTVEVDTKHAEAFCHLALGARQHVILLDDVALVTTDNDGVDPQLVSLDVINSIIQKKYPNLGASIINDSREMGDDPIVFADINMEGGEEE